MIITVRPLPGTMKRAPILVPRTRFQCVFKIYLFIILCIYGVVQLKCYKNQLINKATDKKYSMRDSILIFTNF